MARGFPSTKALRDIVRKTAGLERKRPSEFLRQICGPCSPSRSSPAKTSSSCFFETRPTRPVRAIQSRDTICETFATESFERPVLFAGSSTFPGASAHVKLLVNGTQTTVATRLLLNASSWTTRTGRRKPGPEPTGSGRSAQQTSPGRSPPGALQHAPRCGRGELVRPGIELLNLGPLGHEPSKRATGRRALLFMFHSVDGALRHPASRRESTPEYRRAVECPQVVRYSAMVNRPNFVSAVVAVADRVLAGDASGRVTRDPADDMVLAAAVGGRADWVVSLDRHLIDLAEVGGVRILRPGDFLVELRGRTG